MELMNSRGFLQLKPCFPISNPYGAMVHNGLMKYQGHRSAYNPVQKKPAHVAIVSQYSLWCSYVWKIGSGPD